MDFVYANELKEKYQVFGHYYDLKLGSEVFPCRRVADIIDRQFLDLTDLSSVSPQAVVIMMNPGSSSPADADYQPTKLSSRKLLAADYHSDWTEIKPDNTQYQMMRLMGLQKWQHLRIINLSDLREGNSGTFAKNFRQAEQLNKQNPHSYLHPKRQSELLSLCEQADAVIAAWGSNPVQKEQALACIQLFKEMNIPLLGLPLEAPWYRFASPYRKDQKLSWLKQIDELMV